MPVTGEAICSTAGAIAHAVNMLDKLRQGPVADRNNQGLFSQNCRSCKWQLFKVDPAASRHFCEQVAGTPANIPIFPLT